MRTRDGRNVLDNPSIFNPNLPRFETTYRFGQPTTAAFGIYSLNVTKNFSTFSGEGVRQLILPHYDRSDSVECTLFHRGQNDTYLVSEAGRQC